MRRSLLAAAGFLTASVVRAVAPDVGEADRRKALAEMRQRRILAADAKVFSPQDRALWARMRRAEELGAREFLREKFKTLKGFAVERSTPGVKAILLTRQGFERYLFAKSQDAIQYFEGKGVDPKWAFHLRDLEGRKLFEPDGLLTEDGDELYSAARAGSEVFWRNPAGQVQGSRRRPP